MALPAIPPIGSLPPAQPDPVAPTGAGFGDLLRGGLESVSGAERAADAAATGFAAGDGTKVHEVMIASSKSQIAVDLLSQIRNKAIDAYTEIMRMQV